MLVFVHYNSKKNVGDFYSTPAHYFDWPAHSVVHVNHEVPVCDAVIYGGGTLEPILRNRGIHRQVVAKRRIAWGVGVSGPGVPSDHPVVDDLDLIGLRDFGREKLLKGAWYVPCASCMLPQFDNKFEIFHDVVGFVNADPNRPAPDFGGLPVMDNARGIEETLRWLGSAQTVVTNSFHGAYWATLIGRRVVCIPYSSKFRAYKYPPVLTAAESWRAAVSASREYPEALADCRQINRDFHAKVREVIGL
jgi:hypothetical protein